MAEGWAVESSILKYRKIESKIVHVFDSLLIVLEGWRIVCWSDVGGRSRGRGRRGGGGVRLGRSGRLSSHQMFGFLFRDRSSLFLAHPERSFSEYLHFFVGSVLPLCDQLPRGHLQQKRKSYVIRSVRPGHKLSTLVCFFFVLAKVFPNPVSYLQEHNHTLHRQIKKREDIHVRDWLWCWPSQVRRE